jgi:hypothetical protein
MLRKAEAEHMLVTWLHMLAGSSGGLPLPSQLCHISFLFSTMSHQFFLFFLTTSALAIVYIRLQHPTHNHHSILNNFKFYFVEYEFEKIII